MRTHKLFTRANGTWLNLLHSKQETGKRIFITSSREDLDRVSRDVDTKTKMPTAEAKEIATDQARLTNLTPMPVENEEPWRKRFWKRGITKWQRRIRKVKGIYNTIASRINPTHGMTEEQIKQYDLRVIEEKERKELNKFHHAQAKLCEASLLSVLKRIPQAHHIQSNGSIDAPRFDLILFNPMEYRYHVGRWPYGVSVIHVNNDQVNTDLADAVGHRVRQEFTPGTGDWIIVEIASTLGVPDRVDFKDMIQHMPTDTRTPLTWPVGKTTNAQRIYSDLLSAPHLVIAGTSGFGKSNAQNALACTLMMHNTPEAVKLIMMDMKGGSEFGPYEGAPFLQELSTDKWHSDGLIMTQDDAAPAIDAINAEANRRFKFLREQSKKDNRAYKSISTWNRHRRKNRIPYWVVFIDEFTTLYDECSAATLKKLRRIGNMARAVGIHLVIGSQYPKSDVFDTKLMVNFPHRLVFQLPPNASQSVLFHRGASDMGHPGQALFQTPIREICVQVPYLPDEAFLEIMSNVRAGHATVADTLTTIGLDEICTWALRHNAGKLDRRSVIGEFGERGTDEAINILLRDAEGGSVEIDGLWYKIDNLGGSAGRILKLDEDLDTDTPVIDPGQPTNHKPQGDMDENQPVIPEPETW
jgi:hypothetical protein